MKSFCSKSSHAFSRLWFSSPLLDSALRHLSQFFQTHHLHPFLKVTIPHLLYPYVLSLQKSSQATNPCSLTFSCSIICPIAVFLWVPQWSYLQCFFPFIKFIYFLWVTHWNRFKWQAFYEACILKYWKKNFSVLFIHSFCSQTILNSFSFLDIFSIFPNNTFIAIFFSVLKF